VSVEAAAADGARSHEEVRGKVARLSLGEKTALVKVAKIYARKTRYEYEDLIQECFERVLSGRRQWPQNVPSVVFFTGVMRSIAWEWKSVALPEDAQAIDTGAPERNANSAIDATKLIGIFEDDPIARKLVIAIMDGAKGEELQVLSGLGKTEYESKRTKIRRRIEKFIDAGG
jgi:hypothetical protein